MQQYDYLIKSAVLVLLPLVPAIAIFKIFPDAKAQGEGPFAGIHWKLGGAFSAYVLVSLLLFAAIKMVTPPPDSEVWTVRGKVLAGQQLISQNMLTIRTQPQDIFLEKDGTFEVKLVGHRRGDVLRFPNLVFDLSIGCFAAKTVAVDGRAGTFFAGEKAGALNMTRDADAKEINIITPIQLERLTSATASAPCPT